MSVQVKTKMVTLGGGLIQPFTVGKEHKMSGFFHNIDEWLVKSRWFMNAFFCSFICWSLIRLRAHEPIAKSNWPVSDINHVVVCKLVGDLWRTIEKNCLHNSSLERVSERKPVTPGHSNEAKVWCAHCLFLFSVANQFLFKANTILAKHTHKHRHRTSKRVTSWSI